MCRCLRIQPSGFHARLQVPLSNRAIEDKRQTKMLLNAWTDSGKVYGYRKLHDDLLEQEESICANRVARLTQLAGIKAQIGYKRRPGSYGGKPSVMVDKTLDRQFDVEAPDRVWVTDITYIRTQEGFAYLAVVIDLSACHRMIDAKPPDHGRRLASPAHGGLATQTQGEGADPLRSGQPIHQHGLGRLPVRPQS